jgi:hypothetical protein
MLPDGLAYLGSWVNHEFSVCYQLMEAESLLMFDAWTAAWGDLADFEIIPVRTSAEASRIMALEAP